MTSIVKKSFDSRDELRNPPKTRIEVVDLNGLTAMRAVFQPGWKWSECVKPTAGTESCEVAHLGYMLSGEMVVKMDDGDEPHLKAGEAVSIPPGHDAWIVGDDECVFIDFQGAANYGRSQTSTKTS